MTRAVLRRAMPVDVAVSEDIACPAAEVAAYAEDPTVAPEWYENITSATWETEPPVRLGSRFRFTARFLGRTLAYTYEVTAFERGRLLVMRTAQGPFPMETTYTWDALGPRSTRMTLRNRGAPSGFPRLLAPLMAPAMRRAMRKDLARLKRRLEGSPGAGAAHG